MNPMTWNEFKALVDRRMTEQQIAPDRILQSISWDAAMFGRPDVSVPDVYINDMEDGLYIGED